MSGTDGDSRVGTQFGPYRLRRLIGRGGMGEVYEAEDTVKDRVVALKLLPEGVSHDQVFRKRLKREAHSAGRLQEPHVVPIHDYGEIDGLLYVDMRMIDGTDLRKMLSRFGPLTPARAVAIIRQVASALDAAHESGVTHRDVKPENILITGDDFAYLVDFGIANAATDEKLTEMGTAVGTYAYMAPERFTSDEVTYRADIYSLACVLHECLTGSEPYKADSVSVVITSHLMQPIPKPSELRPGVPSAFDAVIARGMAKKPEERYASAGDLALAAHDALVRRDQDQADTILRRSQAATLPESAVPGTISQPQPTSTPQATPPPSDPQPGSAPRRRKPALIAGIAVAAVVAIVLGGVGIWWLVAKRDSSSTSMPTTTVRSTTAVTAYDSQLKELLPSGYDSTACGFVDPPIAQALSTVECGRNSSAGGPVTARYSLFPDRVTLNDQFREIVKDDEQWVPCPGGALDSPTMWRNSSDQLAGELACGIYDNEPNIAWTDESKLFLGDVRSDGSLAQLYGWWLKV
jgi:serine/threonine kinase PknH